MKTIFIIAGSTGEWDNIREWHVCAFSSKEKAQKLLSELETWTKAAGVSFDSQMSWNTWCEKKRKHFKNPLDPNFELDHTGVEYYILEIPFDDSQ